MMHYVKCMLCAGVVHGDLSEFNVLVDDYGPVVIDLPQAVDVAGNNNARAMLERDVRNITEYYGAFAPELLDSNYAQEMWSLLEEGDLHPDYPLSGEFETELHEADTDAVHVVTHRPDRPVLKEEEARRARRAAAEHGEADRPHDEETHRH